jgi:hypothetical protein
MKVSSLQKGDPQADLFSNFHLSTLVHCLHELVKKFAVNLLKI